MLLASGVLWELKTRLMEPPQEPPQCITGLVGLSPGTSITGSYIWRK
jgi:hypothetical protein